MKVQHIKGFFALTSQHTQKVIPENQSHKAGYHDITQFKYDM